MDVNSNRPVNRSTTAQPNAQAAATNQFAAQPPEEVKKKGFFEKALGFVGDVFVGGGEAILDMGKGLVNTVLHPIQTIKGIGYVITHPASLVHAFVDPYMEAVKSGHPGKALGRGIVEIGSMFVSPSQVAGAAKGAINFVKNGGKGAATVTATTTAAAAAAAKGADYSARLTRGAATIQSKADLLAKAGKGAEAAKMAAYADELAKASALAAAGDAAKAMQMVQGATKGMNATFKAANQLAKASTVASTAANVATKADDVANAASKASKVPALTKTAAKELQKLGITDPTLIEKALKEAKRAYTSTKNLPNLTATDAKLAAARKAAEVLGIDASSTAAQKMANAVSLHGAAATTVGQGVSKTLSNGTKLSTGIAATADDAAKVASVADDASKLSKGVASVTSAGKPISQMTLGEIAHAPVDALQHASSKAGEVISSAAQKLGSTTLGDIVTAPVNAVKHAGEYVSKGATAVKDVLGKGVDAVKNIPSKVANAASNVATKVGSVTLSDILRLPAEVVKYGIQHPRVVMAAGMVANRLQNLPEEAKGMDDAAIEKLTPEQCAEIGKKYGLDPLPGNVKTFLREISQYPGNTIGPDTGTPEEVQQLQNVLKTLGYPVEVNGVFDENTAMSVIDFKTKNFLKQSYRMENGQLAINEYVDQKTADVMMKAVNSLVRPADNGQTSTQSTQATQAPQEAQEAQQTQETQQTQQPAESSVTEATQPPEPQVTETQTTEPAEATQTTETAKPAEATTEPAEPVVYTVKAGDNLSKIAKEQLGDGERWREIYELNKDAIGSDPSLIQIGAQLKMPAKAAEQKPAETAKPAEAAAETTAKAETKLTDAEVQNLAKKYGLATDRENVEKFVNELRGYEESAIGPDLGDEDGVKKLQTVLQGLGYQIESSGKFDDATADAVIDFKKKNGLTQTYKLADGQYAINEYVGPTTAEAMVKKLQEA